MSAARRCTALLLFTGTLVASSCRVVPAVGEEEFSVTLERDGRAVDEVVLPTEQCGGFFVADALVNGRGPFRLLLDTGFPRTQLAERTARSLGVRQSVDSIEVGGLRIRGRVPVGVRDLDVVSHAMGSDIDGILGYTTHGSLLITYDFARARVSVRRGRLPDGPGVMALSRGERPFVHGRLDGDTVALVLDTGFNGAIALREFDDLELAGPPRVVGARVRVGGVEERFAGRLSDDLVFDAFVLRRPVVTDAGERSLLGLDVLRDFVVTLDRSTGRVRFAAATPEDRVITAPALRGTGLVLAPSASHFDVMAVVDGSTGEAAGIAAGDRIVAINGVPVGERGCPDVRDPARTRVLTVDRNGARFDVGVADGVLVP